MKYDVIVVGAGLSGLAAASLLAKRGLKVAVAEQTFKPGGSCGIFKREGAIFDQGSAMMFGFGERGFNGHRFLYNVLEEPIEVIRHPSLYSVYFKGQRIEFHYNIDDFIEELAIVFPDEKENLKRFYKHIGNIYDKVIAQDPQFASADEIDRKKSLKQMIKHPIAYIEFLSYMNKNTKYLLKKYFKNEDILNFFNKLTSTYCYTNVEETPAVLAAIMFIDNHVGGSYYPAGSTIYVPGILEKVIEENGGDMLYEKYVEKILVENNTAVGVRIKNGEELYADAVVFSGTVWNLYGKYLDAAVTSEKRRKWAGNLKPTYPSVVLYALVKKEVIPQGTSAVTLFTENEAALDDDEVTAYILSIDDASICPAGYHTVAAIGPTLKKWPQYSQDYAKTELYKSMKKEEENRLLDVLEKRFSGFKDAVVYKEIATPLSIEKYTLKNNGSVAGPLQSMGQHMLKRLHTRNEIDGLYCCGESTVMGTGTPTVTVTGISAANAILKQKKLPIFEYQKNLKNYVRESSPQEVRNIDVNDPIASIKNKAKRCDYCENPKCMEYVDIDIRGINRRLTVGNTVGAYRLIKNKIIDRKVLLTAQEKCIINKREKPVAIIEIIEELKTMFE